MAEKIFNARFAQKIDTLTAWASSNVVLKAGEIAFATESVDTVVDGVTIKQPIVLAKIGDGSKTFANLPYSFYAKASDVHAWAKMSQEDFETYLAGFIGEKVEDTNTTYTFTDNATDGVLTIKSKDLNTEEQVIATVNYVTPDELAALEARVKAIEDDYVKGTDFETWKTTNTEAINKVKTDAADALSAARTEITAEIDADVKALADGAVKTNTDAIAAEKERAIGVEGGLNTRLTATEGVANAAKSAIDAFLNENAVSDDVVNTLKEIQEGLDAGEESAASLLAEINKLKDGTTPAGKATADAAGNVITETYATKNEVETALNGDEFHPENNITPSSVNGKIDAINYKIEQLHNNVDKDINSIQEDIEGIENTLNTYGDIVTHNVAEFATAAQGAKANTAVQPEDLKPVATSGKLSDLDATFGEGVTDIIFDAGNASGYTQA